MPRPPGRQTLSAEECLSRLVDQKHACLPHTWPAICRQTMQVVKLCLTGVQLINLAAFLFRELQDDVPTAFLAAYLLYRSSAANPKVKVDTSVYKILMFANPLFSPGWTVIRTFRGSFTHAVAKDSNDPVSRHLKTLQRTASFQSLPCWEQLGFVFLASYCRSTELALFFVSEARSSKEHKLCLAATIVKYFKATGGVHKRKRFLADKRTSKRNVKQGTSAKAETVIKHNKDMNRFLLADALALAAVFLDGRLSKHFQGQKSKTWVVSQDVLDDIPFEASRLMPVHILGTLQWLGRLTVGPDDLRRSFWNGTNARVFQSWTGGKSVPQVLENVQRHLEEHRLALKARKADTKALAKLQRALTPAMISWNACQAVTCLSNFAFQKRSKWLGTTQPVLNDKLAAFLERRSRSSVK